MFMCLSPYVCKHIRVCAAELCSLTMVRTCAYVMRYISTDTTAKHFVKSTSEVTVTFISPSVLEPAASFRTSGMPELVRA